jgi:hypothetical protein
MTDLATSDITQALGNILKQRRASLPTPDFRDRDNLTALYSLSLSLPQCLGLVLGRLSAEDVGPHEHLRPWLMVNMNGERERIALLQRCLEARGIRASDLEHPFLQSAEREAILHFVWRTAEHADPLDALAVIGGAVMDVVCDWTQLACQATGVSPRPEDARLLSDAISREALNLFEAAPRSSHEHNATVASSVRAVDYLALWDQR